MIAPTDKIPLKSNMEDLEEFHQKHIDPLTGTIYRKKDVLPLTQEERTKMFIDTERIKKLSDKDLEGIPLDSTDYITSKNQLRWI